MISVIIPVYNVEDYLHVCLNSVLKQSCQDFEIICIDDASTDSSLEILEYFTQKDSRIKVFKNDTKEGLEFCKNKGLNIAKGETVIFLNANEWLSFNALEILSQKSESIFEDISFNKISDFRREFSRIEQVLETDNYKKEIKKLKKDKISLQKKLGQYSKPDVIKKIINKDYSNLTIAIKSPHPKGTTHWGDLFFSKALKKSFEKLGFNVIVQEREQWYDDEEIDIAFVLRGLVDYNVDYSNINLMWNISHPEMISKEEYEKYDQVFISSKRYADKLTNQINTNVSSLLQCTDPEVFYPETDNNISDEILFVGITRGVYREIVRDVLKTNHEVSVYGMGWDKYIDEKYIKGEFIPNEELHKYYSSCKILLNDHWEDMRDEDFPSNRLFDALACGTFVISDKIPSAETLFEGSIITYDDADDLNEKIDYYLAHEDERVKLAEKGRKIVLENHTFDKRVEEILSALCELKF
ncbi:MAG: glycosyltransferase [Methanobrevibacter sp.]|uniref:glycosyltransferase family protein n=1 Tax=Methanobrevibacter sp. TaxID=66852 RepID=UPI0025EC1D6D|nr:glycosyltransferase [Methanobrevibacter sp.]MBE6497308.1 glycosyltransferase [Methanobrevibacter sp.]